MRGPRRHRTREELERLVGYIRDIVRLEHSFMKGGGFFYVFMYEESEGGGVL